MRRRSFLKGILLSVMIPVASYVGVPKLPVVTKDEDWVVIHDDDGIRIQYKGEIPVKATITTITVFSTTTKRGGDIEVSATNTITIDTPPNCPPPKD